MEYLLILDTHEINTTKIKNPRLSSSILNIILVIVACLFVFCSFRFVKRTSITQTNQQVPFINKSHLRKTVNHERYLTNITLEKNQTKDRRYYYIDLGCFDARDIDHFIHFHLQEISQFGQLNVIAFEPDPINLSACKTFQQRHMDIKGTVYDAAIWTQNGQIQYAIEKGQRSKIDLDSALYVRSIDFSQWLIDNFRSEDYVYIKFTIEGSEIAVLEKMIIDESLLLVDYLEIEWSDSLAPEFEPRRIVLECMFDNFGMDFLFMINPVDLKHAYNVKDSFDAVPKDKGWKLKDSLVRFHYKTRKEVIEKLKQQA